MATKKKAPAKKPAAKKATGQITVSAAADTPSAETTAPTVVPTTVAPPSVDSGTVQTPVGIPAETQPISSVPSVPLSPVSSSDIEVKLIGAITDTYKGPAKPLTEMFPVLAGEKKYQLRHEGRIVAQTKPWQASATLSVVEHARHG
jgi:hypothetical protein